MEDTRGVSISMGDLSGGTAFLFLLGDSVSDTGRQGGPGGGLYAFSGHYQKRVGAKKLTVRRYTLFTRPLQRHP